MHVLMSHFTNFSLQLPKQRHKRSLLQSFIVINVLPLIQKSIKKIEKEILLGKKKIKWYFEKVNFNPRIKADLLEMFK